MVELIPGKTVDRKLTEEREGDGDEGDVGGGEEIVGGLKPRMRRDSRVGGRDCCDIGN